MRFQFVDDHQEEFPVRRMCNELNVSPSGYYAWRTRPASAREMANQELYQKIKAVYNDNHSVYGSPRIYEELKDQGVACSENRVARLMRLRGLKAKQFRRFKSTTKRNKAHPAAPNLLKRDFEAEKPDQKWLADGRPFGRLVNISLDMTHHQGWVSSPWRFRAPSGSGLVSFQGTRASCEKEADLQNANVQERMGWG